MVGIISSPSRAFTGEAIGNSSKERFVVEFLLFENKLKSHFTKILCISLDGPSSIQNARAGSDESEAMARIQAQMPSTDKVSLSVTSAWKRFGGIFAVQANDQDFSSFPIKPLPNPIWQRKR